jgi:hypothetical protein
MSHEMEGCILHKEERWRGLCTSLPFFFLETEQEGGNGRRGGGQASNGGSGGSCAGPHMHARSGLQLEQAVGNTGEKKKEEASAKKRVWEKI